MLQKMAERLEGLDRGRQAEAQAAQARAREAAEKAFVASATEEKYPFSRALWSDAELVERGHRVVAEARQAAERTGERFSCTDEDIMVYLESEAKAALSAKAGKLSALLAKVPAESGQKPAAHGQTKAGLPRTLGRSVASERRASPAPPKDLDDKSFRDAAIKAAKAALEQEGKS
jgi:hypothetical protein